MKSPIRLRSLSPLDWVSAILIVAVSAGILLSTMSGGFPRDEGFYFRFSAIYQGWFSDIWHGKEEALTQDGIDGVWRNNREHPPLAKVLMGLSWSALSEKRRPVQRVERNRQAGEADWIHVTGLRRGEGFREGERVLVFGPRLGEPERGEEQSTALTGGVIDAVRSGRVRVLLDDRTLNAKNFRELCGGRYGPKGAWSGCEAILEADLGKWAETTGFRFPTVVFFSLLLGSIYLCGAAWFGRAAGWFAALSMGTVPRHFFHAHLTTFDVPVTAMIFWLVVGFWCSIHFRKGAVGVGLLFGLALLTKLNAFFVPVVLGIWWLSLGGNSRITGGGFPMGSWRLPAFPRSFLWMGSLGVLLFWVMWPRLWFDPWPRFLEYVQFHMHHEHYMQNYFGQILSYPPFPVAFPFVMSALTIPPVLLLLGLLGTGLALIRALGKGWWDREVFGVSELLLIHAFFPVVLIALPSTPVFGGIKHWMTGMPFFCLLGGWAFQRTVAAVAPEHWPVRMREGLIAILVIASVLPGAWATSKIQPEGSAYYNVLAGGLPGAASASMQRQFWGGQTRQGLAYLNEHVPRSGKVYFHKSSRGCWDLYRKEGLLRHDIQHIADIHNFNRIEDQLQKTTHAVYHHQKSHDDYELAIWRAYGTEHPVFQVSEAGVPLLSVYENPSPPGELRKRSEAKRKARLSPPPRPGKKAVPTQAEKNEPRVREALPSNP